MKDNIELGNKIANLVNKKYGVITYSGSLAIELSLRCLNFKKNSKVLVLSEACYSIINAINNVGLKPVIIKPKNDIYIVDEDIEHVLKLQDISCILLVHQYGMINIIDKLKYKKMGIKIIEDIAQIGIINNDYIGNNSDIVVTSFGNTKPMSYGIGGAIFYDDVSYSDIFDYSNNNSREKSNKLYSYIYPLCNKININKLLKINNKNINFQKKTVKKYIKVLKKNNIKRYFEIDFNSWHRYPIIFNNKNKYELFIKYANMFKLEYQLPHEKKLNEIKISKKAIYLCNSREDKYYIYLRTRKINSINQIGKLNKILIKL